MDELWACSFTAYVLTVFFSKVQLHSYNMSFETVCNSANRFCTSRVAEVSSVVWGYYKSSLFKALAHTIELTYHLHAWLECFLHTTLDNGPLLCREPGASTVSLNGIRHSLVCKFRVLSVRMLTLQTKQPAQHSSDVWVFQSIFPNCARARNYT